MKLGSLFSGGGLGILLIPMIWHIPAWEKAKKQGSTKTYQQSEQWPQQIFDKLPGGTK